MDSINMEFPFSDSLSQDEARERIKGLIVKLKNKYGDKIRDFDENWNGNTGTFGFVLNYSRVSGEVTVEPSEVKLSIENLPFAAYFFMGEIRGTIGEEVGELLS